MSRQTVRHAGHRPPVSNVFQAWPHAHDQRSEADGSHEHLGQAIFTGGAVWDGLRTAPPRAPGPDTRAKTGGTRAPSLGRPRPAPVPSWF